MELKIIQALFNRVGIHKIETLEPVQALFKVLFMGIKQRNFGRTEKDV